MKAEAGVARSVIALVLVMAGTVGAAGTDLKCPAGSVERTRARRGPTRTGAHATTAKARSTVPSACGRATAPSRARTATGGRGQWVGYHQSGSRAVKPSSRGGARRPLPRSLSQRQMLAEGTFKERQARRPYRLLRFDGPSPPRHERERGRIAQGSERRSTRRARRPPPARSGIGRTSP